MKRILTCMALVFGATTFAQSPDLMSYQAVVRDASNSLVISSPVGMQISILQGSMTGSPVYEEVHTTTSNANGLVSVEIGNGTVIAGDMALIDWSAGPYFLKTETDPAGGNAYTISGTTQLLSVPYALYSNVADSVVNDMVNDADADPTNELNTAMVLSGTDLSITDAGGTLTTDLSSLTGTSTDDQLLTLSGADLSIESGNTVDLSVLQDGVNDADADPSNEIQTLSIIGSTISLSTGGGSVTVPATPGDDWGTQVVESDATLSGDGTAGNVLSVVGDLTDDQTLSFTSPNLTISGGNSVDLSSLQDGVNDADSDPLNEIQDLNSVLSQGTDANGQNIVNTGSVVVGTATINSSAALEVNSTTQGFLPPVMTDAQRDAIATPAAGLMIYNSNTGCMNFYNGSYWYSMCGDIIPTPGSGLSLATANTDCQQILTDHPSSGDGAYWIDPDGAGGNAPFECYCDMTTDGGGWTLVMSNNQGLANPTPTYANAVNSITVSGTVGSNPTAFDIIVGLAIWPSIGTEVMYQVGGSPSSITNAAKYDISLNAGNNYELSLTNESILVGGTSPGLFTYHPGFQLSAIDADNDISASHCSLTYGSTPWWYGSCWSGSIWGHNSTDGAFWTGSTFGSATGWGGLWIR